MMNDLLHVLTFASSTCATIDPVALAQAISKELPGTLTVTSALPEGMLDRLGEIENGDREFRAADFATADDIDIDTLAAAVHAAVPHVARDALAAAAGRAPNS